MRWTISRLTRSRSPFNSRESGSSDGFRLARTRSAAASNVTRFSQSAHRPADRPPISLTHPNADEHRMPARPVKSPTAQRMMDALRIVDAMKELLRTNNAVRLSWLQALLRDSEIESLVLDHHTSLVEGSIGAIPRRLMVAERDFSRARALLAAAGEDAQ